MEENVKDIVEQEEENVEVDEEEVETEENTSGAAVGSVFASLEESEDQMGGR